MERHLSASRMPNAVASASKRKVSRLYFAGAFWLICMHASWTSLPRKSQSERFSKKVKFVTSRLAKPAITAIPAAFIRKRSPKAWKSRNS